MPFAKSKISTFGDNIRGEPIGLDVETSSFFGKERNSTLIKETDLLEKVNTLRSPSVTRPLSPINETFLSKRKATINVMSKNSIVPAHLKLKESPNNAKHKMGIKIDSD